MNILVVDDEPAIRATLKEYFTELGGFNVDTAEDGVEALEKVRQRRYDAAFLDLQMPRMTGIELLHHIKNHDNTLPVIIMTGFPSLDAAIDTMRHGASDFLTKPVRLSQLQVVLERVLRERQLLIENLRLQDQLRQKEAIERLNAQLNQKVREQALLYNVADSLASAQASVNLYPQMVALASTLVNARQALFFVYNEDEDQLVCLASFGLDGASGEAIKPPPGGFLHTSVKNGSPVIYNWAGKPRLLVEIDNSTELTGETVICLPMKIRGEVFGLLVVAGKNESQFSEDDLFLLQFLINKAALSVENIALYESVLDNLHATLRSLVTAIEAKDPYTRKHSTRVTELAVATARAMGLSEEEVDSLQFSGYLHDIGKIGVSDRILTKPGRLSPEEYEIMRSHPAVGEGIVSHLGLLPHEKAVIRHHHERWDGGGYPDGLAGEDIPLLARVIAVADAYDAMTSTRPYRKALTVDEALAEIDKNAGIQFDRRVVEAFRKMLEENPELL